jgi:hypothetical protein
MRRSRVRLLVLALPQGLSLRPSAMASRKEEPRPCARVPLGGRRPLPVICASRLEIQRENLRLWHGDLPLRSIPSTPTTALHPWRQSWTQ